jgi:hypothetical protein
VAESKTDEIVNVDRDLHIHAVWESNAWVLWCNER